MVPTGNPRKQEFAISSKAAHFVCHGPFYTGSKLDSAYESLIQR